MVKPLETLFMPGYDENRSRIARFFESNQYFYLSENPKCYKGEFLGKELSRKDLDILLRVSGVVSVWGEKNGEESCLFVVGTTNLQSKINSMKKSIKSCKTVSWDSRIIQNTLESLYQYKIFKMISEWENIKYKLESVHTNYKDIENVEIQYAWNVRPLYWIPKSRMVTM